MTVTASGARINMAAAKRQLMSKINAYQVETYRGFEISGAKHFFVGDWPKVYTSRKAAREAIDTCLALRAMLAARDAA